MATTSETGHAVNVANFEQLIIDCTAIGTNFNPSNASIKIPALTNLLVSGKSANAAVSTAFNAKTNAIGSRELDFSQLHKLFTRILNSLKASGTRVQVVENAQTFVRKLQGRRASAKLNADELKTAENNGKPVNQISASQMSFDNRIDNFDKLVNLLATVPQYAPNEADLKVTTLTSALTNLKTKNLAAVSSETALNNARIARDKVLYAENTGMVDISVNVKNYIKSLYGASSPQYKQVSKLSFKKIGRRK